VSKFYVEDHSQIYGCYRCGAVMGEVQEDPYEGHHRCGSCGEAAVISFLNALDMLNEMHLRGEIGFQTTEDIYLGITPSDERQDHTGVLA